MQNAGLYDFAALKDLPWQDWRFFALQLFECRDKPHSIGKLNLDGLKGTAPVLVYDWKTKPDEMISEETIDDIHSIIGKKIGKKFYIIAPMMAFDFFQDYIDKNGLKKSDNRKCINPDDKLSSLLNVSDKDELTYFNIQKYMNKHFVKE